ncbi:MAG: WD40 repeat domain-containing protein [Saprospiraceae bacterium]
MRFITTDAPSVEIRGHKKRINSITFTPDDQYLLTASNDQQIKLWDLQGNEIRTYRGHASYVNTITVSGDGTWFVSGGEEGQLNYWKLDSKIVKAYQLDDAVTSVNFSPDGQRLLVATGGGYQDIFSLTNDLLIEADQLDALFLEAEQVKPAFLYDLEGQLITSLEAHTGPILTVSFSQDGRKILTGSEDGTAIIWDSEGKVLQRLQGHALSVIASSFSPDGSQVATASNDSTVILWDTLGQQRLRLDTFAHIVSSLAFSPDGQYLLSGCRDGKAWLWDLDTYQPRIFVGSGQEISAVAYAPNGKWIAAGESGVKEDSLSIWNVAGSLLLRIAINSEDKTGYGSINSITFSPDSQSIAVATGEGAVKVFDLKGNILQTIRPFKATNASSVAISPNGHWILVGYENGGAKRYTNITNNPIKTRQAQ